MPAPWEPVNKNGEAGADSPLDNLLSDLLGDWTAESGAAAEESAEPAALSAAEMLLRLTGEAPEPTAETQPAAGEATSDNLNVEALARALEAEEPFSTILGREFADENSIESPDLVRPDPETQPALEMVFPEPDLDQLLSFAAPAEEPPAEPVFSLTRAVSPPGERQTDGPVAPIQENCSPPDVDVTPAFDLEPDLADFGLGLASLGSTSQGSIPGDPAPLEPIGTTSAIELPTLAELPSPPPATAAADLGHVAGAEPDQAAESRRRCTAAHAYVLFHLGHDTLAIDAAHVIQVERVPRVTPIPGCASFVRGIVSLRGDVLPLLDLSLLLGHEQGIDPEEGRLVVVRMLTTGAAAALLVERLAGVVYAVPEELGPPIAANDPRVFPWLQAHTNHPTRPFQVLDLARILNHAEDRQHQEGDALWAEPQTKG